MMRKWLPYYHINDIRKIEYWLNERAREGYCIETWGVFWATFKEEPEHDYRYLIDIDDSKGEPNYERKILLKTQGFSYVQTVGTTQCHIYRTKDESAKIIWDEAFIKKFRNKIIIDAVVSGILLLVLLVLYAFLVVDMDYFLVSYMENDRYDRYVADIMSVLAFLGWLRETVGLFKFRKLLHDKEMVTAEPIYYEPVHVPYGLVSFVTAVLSISAAIYGFVGHEYAENYDGREGYVDLRNLEAEGFTISNILWREKPEVNFGNRISESEGLFYEYRCEINQYGMTADGEDVQISSTYWMVRPDSLAEPFVEQLFRRYTQYKYVDGDYTAGEVDREAYWEIEQLSDEHFDRLTVVTEKAEVLSEGDRPTLMIFVQKDDKVVFLQYYGYLPAEVFVEEIEKWL